MTAGSLTSPARCAARAAGDVETLAAHGRRDGIVEPRAELAEAGDPRAVIPAVVDDPQPLEPRMIQMARMQRQHLAIARLVHPALREHHRLEAALLGQQFGRQIVAQPVPEEIFAALAPAKLRLAEVETPARGESRTMRAEIGEGGSRVDGMADERRSVDPIAGRGPMRQRTGTSPAALLRHVGSRHRSGRAIYFAG